VSYYTNLELLLDLDEDGRAAIYQLEGSVKGVWYYRLKPPIKCSDYESRSTRTKNKQKAIEIATKRWEVLLDRIANDLPIPKRGGGAKKLSMKTPRGNIESPIGMYEITNKITGTVYVGISSNIPNRWRDHRGALTRDKHVNKQLQRDWNRWGEWSFNWSAQFYRPDTSRESLEREEQKRITELIYNEGKKVYNTNIKLLTE
tara:strand:- start:1754 stop:2359 length:606 start_codon:yes stop_codon:yes gene_type:complete